MAKRNIKEEIINTTRRLYNQRGVLAVSMRDIAEAVGISVGNLTYHYPRKEALTEAVVLDMHRYYRPHPVPKTLQQLNAIFARIQNNISQNAFYFWHYTEIRDISPTVREIQTTVVVRQNQLLRQAFTNFCQEGLFVPESHEGHFAQLAQAVQILCIYWVPQTKLEAGLDTPKDFLDCVWSVLIPCLTPKGREVYQEKVVKVRVDFDARP